MKSQKPPQHAVNAWIILGRLNMLPRAGGPCFFNHWYSLVADRARELCVEGERRWDLIRLGRFMSSMNTLGITIDDYHLLFPFPQAEMQVNHNLTQNPGLN